MSENENTTHSEKPENLLPQDASSCEFEEAASKVEMMVNQICGMMFHEDPHIYTEETLKEMINANIEGEKIRSSEAKHLINWLGSLIIVVIIGIVVIVWCCIQAKNSDFLKDLFNYVIIFGAIFYVNIGKYMKRFFREEEND